MKTFKDIRKIILVVCLFAYGFNLLAQDKIIFTWTAEELEENSVKIQATEGKQFTVNWDSENSLEVETIIGEGRGRYITLIHNYSQAREYIVTITANDDCRFLNFDCSSLTNSLSVIDCSDLMSMRCYNTQLRNLDLSGCSALDDLICSSNQQLTSLNLSGCTVLRRVLCSDNQLTSLNLSGCIALKGLDCRGNKLTRLDLTDCVALWNLYCNGNQLTELNVNGYLNSLSCYGNRLHLSDLYYLSTISNRYNTYLGPQELLPDTIVVGIPYGEGQDYFGGNYTWCIWGPYNINGIEVNVNDYTFANGKITFHSLGTYKVGLTNWGIIIYDCNMENAHLCFPLVKATITVVAPLGISEFSKETSIKTRTDNGMLHISGQIAGKQLKIYNIVGELIHQCIPESNETTTLLPANGVYFVHVDYNVLKVINF